MEALKERLLATPVHAQFLPRPDLDLGWVASVHDGDTLTVHCEIRGVLENMNIRVRGIDAPELKGDSKTAAAAVREVVKQACHSKYVRILNCGSDKYGRLLGDVILEGGESLSAFLVRQQLVKVYTGQKKDPFTEEELRQICERAMALLQ